MPTSDKPQAERFKKAARESGADMTKEEFARVIGGLAKLKPERDTEQDPKAEGKADA